VSGSAPAPAPSHAQPHRDQKVVLAIDVGIADLSVGILTMRGALIDRDSMAIDRDLGAQSLYELLEVIVVSQLQRAREHHATLPVAVGVAIAASAITPNLTAPDGIPAWRDFPLRSRLQASTQLPVFMEFDGRALALAEGWLGAAAGHAGFIAMQISSGVSGGIVLDGQLLEGASGVAGQIGHVIVEPNGRRCSCGARGCLQSEVSANAIEAITGRPLTQPNYEIMQRTGRLVGRAVASVCNSLDLDLAVVGGSVALGFGATFFNSAQESLDGHARLSYTRGARITPARLGERGPMVGAGALAIRELRRAGSRASV
jgi:glucokinase